jgi:hypothetical protein
LLPSPTMTGRQLCNITTARELASTSADSQQFAQWQEYKAFLIRMEGNGPESVSTTHKLVGHNDK